MYFYELHTCLSPDEEETKQTKILMNYLILDAFFPGLGTWTQPVTRLRCWSGYLFSPPRGVPGRVAKNSYLKCPFRKIWENGRKFWQIFTPNIFHDKFWYCRVVNNFHMAIVLSNYRKGFPKELFSTHIYTERTNDQNDLFQPNIFMPKMGWHANGFSSQM